MTITKEKAKIIMNILDTLEISYTYREEELVAGGGKLYYITDLDICDYFEIEKKER